MDKNSDEFLSAFNRIEKQCNNILKTTSYIPFSHLIDEAAKQNKVVKYYEKPLKAFADLRNAIVHNEIEPGYVLAEPHDSVVKNIVEIAKKLKSPEIIGNVIHQKISSFSTENELDDVLTEIEHNNFTQFPIFSHNGFEGLLTENGITYWLAANMKEDIISLSETKVKDILSCEESKENYRFINRKTPIYEIEGYFQKFINNGQNNGCLLITNDTKRVKEAKDILGIVTPWDLTKINKLK
ncbi:hypothetical protein [Sporolactobacillus sp. THM19-2]|uniref:hypothetical protein n=1 Tax=Sporolactobacillus sp. THM19-2 TaxID=2511171 RepID=UPI00102159E5|nr:hypothetical protein [Sporolactobacillus sp. THM19-2]RYL94416.1 hypothetical protein EWH91_00020 [Sporolactobacillus sp. THM19-2]